MRIIGFALRMTSRLIFEKGLGIRPKEFEKDKEFIRLVRTSGLKLKDGESWMGMGKKGGVPKHQGGKKKN